MYIALWIISQDGTLNSISFTAPESLSSAVYGWLYKLCIIPCEKGMFKRVFFPLNVKKTAKKTKNIKLIVNSFIEDVGAMSSGLV